MPLFTRETARGFEVPAMLDLAARFAECTALQDLNDGQDAAATSEKIVVCHETDPWDVDLGKFSVGQLEQLLLEVNIVPAEQNSVEATTKVGDPEGRCPDWAAAFEARLLRQIREHEIEEHGVDDVYAWFCDRSGALCQQLHLRADAIGSPIVTAVRRAGRPLWNPEESASAQGRHLWCLFEIECGSRGGSDGE